MAETTIKERLVAYLELKRISKSEFGRRIGVSNAFVTSLKKSISPDKLQLIKEEFPDLNIEWLQFGFGSMLKEPETALAKREEDQTSSGLIAALREAQAQNTKSQEQIDRLLGIIESFQKAQ